MTVEKAWTGVGECFTLKYDRRILKIKSVLLVFTDSKMCEPPPLGTQKYDIYRVTWYIGRLITQKQLTYFLLKSTTIQLRTFSAHVRAKRFLLLNTFYSA